MTPEETVATEKGFAPRVAALTIVAGLFPVIGTLIQGPISDAPKNFLANLAYYDQHSTNVIIGSTIRAIGFLALIAPITFLLRAAIARGQSVPRFTPVLAVVGAVILFIATIALAAISVSISTRFANDSGLTYDQAKSLLKGQAIVAASAAGLLGSVAVAFGLVMASLNAMRVGMLTRFMGYIGVLAAALLVLPIFSPLPVIQGFWLVAVGVLIYGYWPSGRSDAWEDGTAHPWPSAAESRAKAAEAREASRNGKAG